MNKEIHENDSQIESQKSEVKWTDEQRDAFEDRNHNLLVSASAGSGKTTVMIKRIVDLVLEEKVPISKFLVVTFTKASASDMKKKLIDALLKNQNDSFVIEQIEDVESSDISNLHSFCSRLISTYFYEVGVDPSYHVIDDAESTFLKDRALTKLFEQKEKLGDFDYFELFEIFQKKRNDKQLRDIVKRFNDYLNSNIDGKMWFFDTLTQTHDVDFENNLAAKLINRYVSNAIFKDAEKAEKIANECLNFGQQKLYDYFIDVSQKLRTVNKNNSFLINAKNVYDINFGTKPVVNKKIDGYEYIGKKATVVNDDLKDNLSNYRENFVSNDESILLDGINSAKKRLLALFNLVEQFNEIYSALKKDANGLDFNDLEKFALKILSNNSILKAVQEKYEYVFVDEYQDINNVQEKILSLVSRKNNRFMVGDIKQSIYRFRLCDPDIFLNKYELFGKGGEFNKLIKLNCNFRSDKKILKFVDRVFSDVMTDDFGGVDYKKDALFVAGEKNLDNPESVNLCFIDTTKEKEERGIASGVYSVENHQQKDSDEVKIALAEARFVAGKIAGLVDKKKENSIDYQDIAILVGARNEAIARFVEALRAYGIPVSSDEKQNLMKKKHILEIVNFVKLLCNFKDDFVLFKVLKSRLFNFEDSELVEIRKLNKKCRFFDCFNGIEDLDNQELKTKTKEFLTAVERFSVLSKILTLKELVLKIIEEFCLEDLNLMVEDGFRLNQELEKFIEALPNVDAFDFVVNYANFELEVESECGGDAVKLMTIHKSKGIEFKAVFLVNTANGFNFASTRGNILFNKDFGVGLDYFNLDSRSVISSVPISAIRMIERRKLVEEQQRVWYVALTRAVEKMFIVCSKQIDKLNEKFPERPNCFANWVEPIISEELAGKHNELIEFETYHITDLIEDVKRDKKQLILTENNDCENVWFDYDYKNSVKIPLKNSVSKILKNSDFEDDYESNMFNFDGLLSSADRGSAYHKVFENIDLKNINNIDSQLESIKNLFDEKDWKLVDEKIVKDVLNLQFFKQIQQDDVIFKEREFYALMPGSLIKQQINSQDKFIMQGVIDLIVVKPEALWILDYKTGQISDDKLEKYKFQLQTYADVASRAFKKPVEKLFLCLIDSKKIIEI